MNCTPVKVGALDLEACANAYGWRIRTLDVETAPGLDSTTSPGSPRKEKRNDPAGRPECSSFDDHLPRHARKKIEPRDAFAI